MTVCPPPRRAATTHRCCSGDPSPHWAGLVVTVVTVPVSLGHVRLRRFVLA
ncbi:hypothetical protein [Streptomyces sp. Ru62]|uniref:hypothetical protein n=1 Tax=Streptomyces sp. Ru62 TaxID=2080745 RepID=UPI0015E3925A|nr:hypothetical protein [Streptomyces sp. Ru62]